MTYKIFSSIRRNDKHGILHPGAPVNRPFPSFLPSVLFSYVLIIIICTLIMGVFFYQILGTFITDHTIASSNKLLSQYKNSVDSLILKNINDISIKILNDVNNNSYLDSYFNKPLENNTADVYEVSRYLTDMKLINPLIYSLSIFYKDNELLVSTDYIRHNLYNSPENQENLRHYWKTVSSANNNPDNIGLLFDYGATLDYKLRESSGHKLPESLIHAVRLTYGYNRKINGAIIITVNSEIFSNLLKKVASEDLGSIMIADRDGLILCHTDSNYAGKNISELGYYSGTIFSAAKPGYFKAQVDGIPTVVSYQISDYSDWRYISVAPMKEVTSAARFFAKTVVLVSLLSTVIGLFISFFAAKRLARPLKTIANACRAILFSADGMKEKNEYMLINSTLNGLQSAMKEKDKEIKEIMPICKINFLNALLSDNPPHRNEIFTRMNALGISMPHKLYCAAAVKVAGPVCAEDAAEFEYEKKRLISQFEDTFSTRSSSCILYEKDNIIKAVVNHDLDEAGLMNLAWKFLECTGGKMVLSKYLAFGEPDTDILQMNKSLRLAVHGLDYSYIFPEKHLYSPSEILFREEGNRVPNKLQLNNFANSLKSLDREKSISDLKEVLVTLRTGNFSYRQAMASLSACVSSVKEFIHTSGEEYGADLYEGLKTITNIFEFDTRLTNIINYVFDAREKTGSGSNMELVNKAKKLIDREIQSNQISLKHIAGELGVSEKYLSKVFKNETNVKFVDYITNLKLNHSRSLLLNSGLKVEEISSLMGYSTPQYFISRFKLMFGCTPGEYRQKNLTHS